MAGQEPRKLDSRKMLENALASIQLGVEDYQLSSENGSGSIRSISAARNLFAGVLLLFKYKIASVAASPEQAATLIYKARRFRPHRNVDGNISWAPELERHKTIDTEGIKRIFNDLAIETNWEIVEKLRDCRNDLEHLHANHPVEEINQFMVALFPLLRDFITNQIGTSPSELLGTTWDVMLKNHYFFTTNLSEARCRWNDLGVMDHTMELFRFCVCPSCGSALLEPNREDALSSLRFNDSEFRYSCIACSHSDSFTELLAEELRLTKEDPFDEAIVIIECDECWHPTFDLTEGFCHLCTYQRKPTRCSDCEAYITWELSEQCSLCDRCQDTYHQLLE